MKARVLRHEVLAMTKLNGRYINSLPQPFFARFAGGDEFLLYDIDVETGLLRVDVCGVLEIRHIGEVVLFRDTDEAEHDPETFYSDDDEEVEG